MPNTLAQSASPYLRQHQHNPVDWQLWGESAFEEARRRDVPIFLSVGYSTCYWCHVMERESFENHAIAELMNRAFVCVKVDREERPDVDDIYMAAVQAFSGRGGWPMSVFIDPSSLKPFWAGTYFPPADRYLGVPSFPRVLEGMASAWREQREAVLAQAEQLGESVAERISATHAPSKLSERQVVRGVGELLKLHDRALGGFGPAPKFPQPVYLDLLLDARAAADDATRAAIDTVLRSTLDAMAHGGIHDQVGGGFHRYSVDERWTVPHFEKMLYDNAQLLGVYALASRVYDSAAYRRVARRIVTYMLRELRTSDGAFMCAQDAEVEHREGLNYIWTPEQARSALAKAGPEETERLLRIYGLDVGPNFQDPHHPDEPAAHVLRLARSGETPEQSAQSEGTTLDEWFARLDAMNDLLLDARSRRAQPGTDFKVLAGWNGLAIAGLAMAGRCCPDARAMEAAAHAADFVLAHMRDASGGLLRCHALGRAHTPAPLEDYAMLAHGLARLHRALDAEDSPYLRGAIELVERAEALFADEHNAGYFDTAHARADLFIRSRGTYDGAIASGVSFMLHALIDLGAITGQTRFVERAARCMNAISGAIARSPLGTANSTRALLRLLATDRAALEAAQRHVQGDDPGAETGDGDAGSDEPGEPEVVEILAEGDSVRVLEGQPAVLSLRVRIAHGHHIIAADPGDGAIAGALAPLRVGVTGGSGVRVYADYPEGVPFGEGDARVLVHEGEVSVDVVIERQGEWSGTPLLTVSYQACSHTECMRPRIVELDVTIERV